MTKAIGRIVSAEENAREDRWLEELRSILELSPIKVPGTPLVVLHEHEMLLSDALAERMRKAFCIPPSEHEADEDPK